MRYIGLRNVKGAAKIFEGSDGNGNLIILIAKTVDEFFYISKIRRV